MHKSPLIYLAGPCSGLTHVDAKQWRLDVSDALNAHDIGVINPLRVLDHLPTNILLTDIIDDEIMAAGLATFQRCDWDVRRCDAVLVNFLGACMPSLGTTMEIAWAHAYHKPIVIVDTEESVHNHCMIRGSTPYLTSCLDDAIEILSTLFR